LGTASIVFRVRSRGAARSRAVSRQRAVAIAAEEWSRDLVPFSAVEAKRRGVPIRIEGEHMAVRLEGEWRRWRHNEAFAKLIPIKVAKASQETGVVAPQLVQIVAE
jgi:hypothetical protein